MTQIVLVNKSVKLTADNMDVLTIAMQTYVNAVTKAWSLEAATVKYSTTKISGAWNFYLVDTFPADAPKNSLGYHNYSAAEGVFGYISAALTMPTPVRTPFGKILYGRKATKAHAATITRLEHGSLSEVISHELAEALIDPYINNYKLNDLDGSKWLIEVGDQAHAYNWMTTVTRGIIKRISQDLILADFTLPSFYTNKLLAPYSYTNQVTSSFHLDKNCYAYIIDKSGKPKLVSA